MYGMPHYIDIHCHLDFPELYDEIEKIIHNAKQAGVKTILTNGWTPKTNRIAIELSKKYSEVKAALGFYPPDAHHDESFTFKEVEKEIIFIRKNKNHVHAIGEVGMDFKDGKDQELQEKSFRAMISLAKELDVPLLIHSRKAEEEVINILEQEKAKKVILHCFSGKKKFMIQARDLGYFFSVPTNIVNSEHFQLLVNLIPISQLFAETDAPFLSPFKEKHNQPSYVVESYKKIAEIKKLNLEEVKQLIFLNYQRMFL